MVTIKPEEFKHLSRRMVMIARRLDDRRRVGIQRRNAIANSAKMQLTGQAKRLDKSVLLCAVHLAEELAEYLERKGMLTFASFSNQQLYVEAVRVLRHLLRFPLDVEAARQSGLVSVELERRGAVEMWEKAKREAAYGATSAA